MKNPNIELKALVAQERNLLHKILLKIREIDESRLYLNWGHSSLYDYLTLEIGYSHGAAQRRIDAARLSAEIPEVIEQIREGSLNLSQIGEAQKGFRRTEVGIDEKKEILQLLSASPAKEAEKIVAVALELPVMSKPVSRPQSDGSLRLALTLSEQGAVDLAKVKEKLSHVIPNGDPGEIFEKLLAFYLAKQPKSTAAPAVNPRQKGIPAATRRAIFARDQACQFRAENGRLCGSRHQLQVDHIQMRFHGGGHEPENLRLLCGAHNRYVAEQTMFGGTPATKRSLET